MAKSSISLTADRLREVLHYDPETGDFTWIRTDSGRRKRVGTVSCNRPNHAYIAICIDGKKHLAHRLAYLWMYGRWPASLVDHFDWNGLNNKWSNLRVFDDLPDAQNQRHRRGLNKNNTSGIRGIGWDKRKRKWRVRVCDEHLGYFEDKEEAERVARLARKDW